MAIHDFVCVAHGQFTKMVKADEMPPCPHGCSSKMVRKVFLKPPGFVSRGTRASDNALQMVSQQHGLSDMRSDDMNSVLNNAAKGITSTMAMPIVDHKVAPTLENLGVQGDNALKAVSPMLHKPVAIPIAKWDGK